MKQIISITIALLMLGCGHTLNSNKRVSQGAPYEVLVVCNAPEWESELGEKINEALSRPVEMLASDEPVYRVLRITAGDFKNLLIDHRNILQVYCHPGAEDTRISAQYDVNASPQIVLTFEGPTQEAMLKYINENSNALVAMFEKAERDRTIFYARNFQEEKLTKTLCEKFNLSISIPKGYTLRNEKDHFLWASYEFPTASQGFFMYSFPYRGKESLSLKNLILQRDIFASNIPGPSEGSYMTTVHKIPDESGTEYIPFEPSYKVVEIAGTKWVELRGLWEVENDFMGGPFVSYATLNPATREVVVMDCYVYSPKHPKRNYLRALEHLMYTIHFPKADSSK